MRFGVFRGLGTGSGAGRDEVENLRGKSTVPCQGRNALAGLISAMYRVNPGDRMDYDPNRDTDKPKSPFPHVRPLGRQAVAAWDHAGIFISSIPCSYGGGERRKG